MVKGHPVIRGSYLPHIKETAIKGTHVMKDIEVSLKDRFHCINIWRQKLHHPHKCHLH